MSPPKDVNAPPIPTKRAVPIRSLSVSIKASTADWAEILPMSPAEKNKAQIFFVILFIIVCLKRFYLSSATASATAASATSATHTAPRTASATAYAAAAGGTVVVIRGVGVVVVALTFDLSCRTLSLGRPGGIPVANALALRVDDDSVIIGAGGSYNR